MTRRQPIWLLCGWTLLVWGGRIRNIFGDADLVGAERLWRLGLAGSFVVLGLWLLGALVADRRSDRAIVVPALALAVWTTVVWVTRAVGIALGDHEAGFIAVHLILAAISIGLAAWSTTTARRAQAVFSSR